MEVTVRCFECNSYLEEHKMEKEYSNDACIYVAPCETCMEQAKEQP